MCDNYKTGSPGPGIVPSIQAELPRALRTVPLAPGSSNVMWDATHAVACTGGCHVGKNKAASRQGGRVAGPRSCLQTVETDGQQRHDDDYNQQQQSSNNNGSSTTTTAPTRPRPPGPTTAATAAASLTPTSALPERRSPAPEPPPATHRQCFKRLRSCQCLCPPQRSAQLDRLATV